MTSKMTSADIVAAGGDTVARAAASAAQITAGAALPAASFTSSGIDGIGGDPTARSTANSALSIATSAQATANLALPSASFTSANIATAGGIVQSNIATLSFDDLYPGQSNLTDQTRRIQDGLFAAQRLYYSIRGNRGDLDDQFVKNDGVRFVIAKRFAITSPIYVPENVKLVCPNGIVLGTLSGSPSVAYGGDPTAGTALINVYQPMLIIPIRASCDDITLYAKNGTQSVSGLCYGKNWVITGLTISNGGSGYTPGDTITLPQPSKAPYFASTATVSTVNGSGAITGITLVSGGAYSVPPAGQLRYWTVANGYTGTIANGLLGKVFDTVTPTAYVTTGGTGTGATVLATWKPDFAADGTDYDTGVSLQGDGKLGDIRVQHAGIASDATYGKQFGIYFALGLYCTTGVLAPQGGYYGILSKLTDFHPQAMLPVQAQILLKLDSCSSVNCEKVVLDTWDISALDMDACSGIRLIGRMFQGPDPITNNIAPVGFRIGQNKTTRNKTLDLNFRLSGGGYLPGTDIIGAKVSYISASVINIDSGNIDSNNAVVTTPIAILYETGIGITKNNVLSGYADYGVTRTIKPIAGQVMPNCLISIREARRRSIITGNAQIAQNSIKAPRGLWNSAIWPVSGGATAANDPTVLSPSGKRDVTKITWSGSNQFIRQSFTTSGSDEINGSIWLKAGTVSQVYFFITDAPASNYGRIITLPSSTGGTISTPSTLGSGVLLNYEVQDYGGGWQKFTIVGTFGLGSAYLQLAAVTGQTSGYFYAWGGQVLLNPINSAMDGLPLEPAPMITSVSTTATTITYAQADGELITVNGFTGSTTFTDIIMTFVGRVPAVIYSDTGSGGPAARTYTYSSGAIQLAMASGTYSISTTLNV